MKGSKPDFLDLDKDNNKTESMKSAAASAKGMMKGGRVKKMGGGSMMKKREAMKKGSSSEIAITHISSPETAINLSLSLDGFTAAFDIIEPF